LPRKLILDIDPGIDDAISLAIALFDPRLDILAVTATGGSVSPQQATANVQALVALLDPPKLPRLGAAPTDVPPIDHPWNLHGADGLGIVHGGGRAGEYAAPARAGRRVVQRQRHVRHHAAARARVQDLESWLTANPTTRATTPAEYNRVQVIRYRSDAATPEAPEAAAAAAAAAPRERIAGLSAAKKQGAFLFGLGGNSTGVRGSGGHG
jgi:hypothetical protein